MPALLPHYMRLGEGGTHALGTDDDAGLLGMLPLRAASILGDHT